MGNGAKYGPVSVPSATLSPEAVALRRHIALLACVGPSGLTSLPSFVALGHLLREIIATSGSYYGDNGANTGQLAYLRRHFHRKRCTETPHCTFGMRGPSGPNKSAKFRRSGSPTPRDNRDFRLLLWGNGAKYGPVSVPSATLSPEAVALRRHIALLALRGPSGQTSLPSFVALGHLLREIIATSGSIMGW
ncbi:hypothetical protein DPMN_087856 [Dreissena polymorpha]|uniref:Uncharacterized protein n=1 Tax=Dreissena polymorpha TaxID=45954 RepID=A0A9D4KTI3_DREPO|nr:hypothetical protein DPMN_087856 [Dreissena polymorpha]